MLDEEPVAMSFDESGVQFRVMISQLTEGPMTVASCSKSSSKMPKDAVVLMESGGGLSRVGALDFVEEQGPGAPAEVILLPSMDEWSLSIVAACAATAE